MSELREAARWLSRELRAGREAVKALSAPQLANSSIEAGKVEEYDIDGTLVSVVGEQFDGTHAAVTLAGPVPPEPTAPTVTAGINTAEVRWNGKFADDALSPMDFSHVTVHASRLESFDPDATTQKATITGESGDTATLALDSGEWYFLLVAVSKAGKWSDPSDTVLGEVQDFLQDAVTDALIDLDTKYDGVIQDAGELDGRLTTAEGELTDHNTRIADAETDLTTAFGQLGTGTVDDRVATAKQGAIDSAASTAQAKADAAKQAAITAAAADAQTKADTALAAANAQVAQVIARGQSLVRNGDFEAGDDGWDIAGYKPDNRAAIEAGTPRSGVKSMRIGPNPGGNTWPTSEWVPGATGRTYYLEAWFKRTGTEVKAAGVGFVVQAKTAAGGTGTITPGRVDSATISTTAFTKVSVTYTVATADAVSVRFAPWILAGNNVYNVDDMLVVDVTEAQAALTAATDAQTAATNAQTAAGNAQTTATNALTMATSKSKVYYSTSAPSGTGTNAGDLWRQRDGSNAIIGEWQWSDAATPSWVKQTVSGSNVSNMDIGYLTAGAATMSQALIDKLVAGTANFQRADIKNLFATSGTMDTAVINKLWTDVVNSRKITTTMLAVGSFDNIIPDPAFTNTNSEWGEPDGRITFPATDGRTGGGALKIIPNTLQAGKYSTRIKAAGAASYLVSVWVKSDVAIPAGSLGIYVNRTLTATGGAGGATNILQQTSGAAGNDPIAANIWTRIYGIATVDATWYDFALGFYKQTTFTTGTVWFSDPSATRMNAGELVVDGTVKAKHLEVNMVLVNDIIAGNPAGQHARMTPTGFKVLAPVDGGAPAEVVSLGSSTSDFFAVTGAGGQQLATINEDGDIAGQNISAEQSFTYKGTELQTFLADYPQGVDTSGFGPASGVVGNIVGVWMRVIGVKFVAKPGRNYKAVFQGMNVYSTVAGDRVNVKMSYARNAEPTSGTAPTDMGITYLPVANNAITTPPLQTMGTFNPSDVEEDITVIVWIRRETGSGNIAYNTYNGDANYQKALRLWIEDMGPDVPETGTLYFEAGATPPASAAPSKITRTAEYGHTAVRSYQGSGSPYSFDTAKGYQGLSPAGYGNLKSIWSFPSVTSLLSGATVNDIWAYFYFEHWYYGAGGTARIMVHGNSSSPATYAGGIAFAVSSGSWPRGAGRWVRIPNGPTAGSNAFYDGFRSGTYKGFALEGDGTYGTYGIANAARLRIKYTK